MAGKNKSPTASQCDIAIVGGGVSGVYSAWRLKARYPRKKIVLIEASDHIGGRLLSVVPPGIPNMVAELGGMRILPKTQPLIVALLKELNKALPKSQGIETYPFPVDQPQNIAFLRGTHLRLSDFTQDPDKVPYRLSFLERGNSSGVIMVNAIEQIVPGITAKGLTNEQRHKMAREASFDGQPLYQLGFWNLLLRVITGEAYQLGLDAGGYESVVSNWNAADAIPWFLSDFGIDPEYFGFKKGFQQVPLALAELFKKQGGEIRLETRLQGFEHNGGRFTLTLGGGARLVADALILAMPRRSLDLVAPSAPLLQQAPVARLIASVTPQPLFKLFTTYANPWWRAAGYYNNARKEFVPVESGRTVTSLPVRQTYYWPTSEGKPAQSGPAMLMASYDDGSNIGFWDGLRPQRRQAWRQGLEVPVPRHPFEPAATPALLKSGKKGGDAGASSTWSRYQASDEMVDEVARQLGSIHGLSYSPTVEQAAFRDWGDDPFGGGWNSWNIGVKSWEVKDQITQPLASVPLFICGEAYSNAQGWVEGALETADIMLKKLLK
ncbi:MAG: flavin monoamine oxidase family protein [Ramlibacter sp.]